MSKHPLRAVFGGDILTEILMPERKPRGVVILCDGLPSVPCKGGVLSFFAKKGFVAVHMRYRGTWESGGRLFSQDPSDDVLDVISEIFLPFKDAYFGMEYRIPKLPITVIGTSFGGPSAIRATEHPVVVAAIGISSVVDWIQESEEEPLDVFPEQVNRAFGSAYRVAKNGWKKLYAGEIYQPVNFQDIQSEKLLLIHGSDDKIIDFKGVERFANERGIAFLGLKRKGHLSSSMVRNFLMWRKIRRFIYSRIN